MIDVLFSRQESALPLSKSGSLLADHYRSSGRPDSAIKNLFRILLPDANE